MKVFTWLTVTAFVWAFNTSLAAQSQEFQGQALEHFLAEAKIMEVARIGQGVTNPHKAMLELDGKQDFAVWKIVDVQKSGPTRIGRGTEIEFQDSWRTEIAAYEMDKLLGLGMVPATVERSYKGARGSIQYWVSTIAEAERVKRTLHPPNAEDWTRQMFKVRLFDNLIYNTDRHANNLLLTEDFKVRLIDHSRAFRPFDDLRDSKSLLRFSKSLLSRIGELNEPLLKDKLGKYLTPAQIRGILKRRDAILKLADDLVKRKGEAAVLYP